VSRRSLLALANPGSAADARQRPPVHQWPLPGRPGHAPAPPGLCPVLGRSGLAAGHYPMMRWLAGIVEAPTAGHHRRQPAQACEFTRAVHRGRTCGWPGRIRHGCGMRRPGWC
jgi:hypothetical protein